jgi:ribosomal-protein-alanine N-acetyltransferase
MLKHSGSISLSGQRVLLRPVHLSDAQDVFDTWAADPEVTRYLRWNPHASVEVTKAWLNECEANLPNKDWYHWGIVVKQTGKLIGSMGAIPVTGEPGCYEVGYCIGKPYWNRGYTSEALITMLGYLTDTVGIKSFLAKHAKENGASGAVMRKADFVRTGEGTYESFDKARSFECAVYRLSK